MAIQVTLSEEEKAQLEKLRNKHKDYRSERALMVLLNSEGLSAPKIAENLKRHPNTVRAILHDFKNYRIKGLSRDYSPGRPSTKRQKAIELINKVIEQHPQEYGYQRQIWTKNLLIDLYRKKIGKISSSTMERALDDAGYSWKRPKKTVPKEAPTKEEKIARLKEISKEIEDFAGDEDTEIMFIDESHFSTEPYMIKGWYKTGESFFFKHSQKKGKLHYFWRLENKGTKILLEKFKER